MGVASELDRYNRDKKRAENKGNLKEAAQMCNLIGELLSREGRYDEAISEHQEELFMSDAIGDRLGAAVANRKIGECYCEMGKFDEALKYQNKHLQIAKRENSDLETQRAYATIGRTYLFQAESSGEAPLIGKEALKKAKLAFLQSLEFCDKVKSECSTKEYAEMRARLLLNLGLVYEQRGEITKCSELLKKAITISEAHTLREDVFRCQNALVRIYQRNSNYSQALKLLNTAIRYAESSNNKCEQTDLLIQKAMIFLQLDDFLAAPRTIRKAYKLNSSNAEEKERIGTVFKAVIIMEKLTNELNAIPEMESERRMPIYEKLGDSAAGIGNFKQAIAYYNNMLKCALKLGKSESDMIPVYVSLAQTYKDDKQYDKAVEFFHKELECRSGDNKQMAATWLNIADAEELGGESYNRVMQSYRSAYQFAKAASLYKVQAVVLKSQSVSQGNYRQTDAKNNTLEELHVLREMCDLDSDIELSDTEEESSQDFLNDDEIDLEEYLSDSDASENEEYDRSKPATGRVTRRKTKANVKRNEKGETPLHRACIEGDVKKVKALISQDHPINPRDFCGWIPLHEAANHDRVEIVEMLLNAKAWINDRGGKHCNGITPLHDACSCGNINVIKLLISRGANVHAKDDDGNTSLDSLLDFIERSREDMTREDLAAMKAVEKLIRDTMRGNNPHLSKSLMQSQIHRTVEQTQQNRENEEEDCEELPTIRHNHRSLPSLPRPITSTQLLDTDQRFSDLDDLEESVIREYEVTQNTSSGSHRLNSPNNSVSSTQRGNKRLRTALTDSDDDESVVTPTPRPYHELDKHSTGRGAYQDVMADMRRSAVSRAVSIRHTQRRQSPSRSVPALVDNDYVGDDWMIDDMGVNAKPAKRKRIDPDGITTTTGTRRSGESNKKPRRERREEKRRSRETADSSDDAEEEFTRRHHPPSGVDEQQKVDVTLGESSRANRAGDDDPVSDDSIINAFTGDDDDDVMFYKEPDFFNQSLDVSETTQPTASNFCTSTQNRPTQANSVVRTFGAPVGQTSNMTNKGLSIRKPRQTTLSNFGVTTQPAVNATQHGLHQQHVPGSSGDASGAIGTATQQPSTPQPMVKPVMRLKVRIKDRVILVPVPGNEKTISWLSEEAAQRYYKLYNMRPLLSIATKDGAILSPEDPVSFILVDNEEVEGQVQSWDLPPLPERYTDACSVQKTVMYRNVRTQMVTAETTHKLELRNLALRPPQLTPIYRALQCQYLLKELCLSGNRIGNDGFNSLCEVLKTLPSLTMLDVTSNCITGDGLRSLAKTLEKTVSDTEKPLTSLSCLCLSYNPLGDGLTATLATIVHNLPALRCLNLVACDLTVRFFQDHRLALADALQGSRLSELDVSMNILGSTGVELLLRCLKHQVLTHLNISGVLTTYTQNHFMKNLYAYMTQADSALTHLSLDNTFLLPELWPDFTELISKSHTLEHLSLSINSKITNNDIAEILESAAQSDTSRLSTIIFTGCNIQSPLATNFIDAVNDKLSHKFPLRMVRFSCRGLSESDRDTLREIWSGRWSDDAQCEFNRNGTILLTTADTL